MATGFLMRHCAVSHRCTAQYRQVDIFIPPPMRSASPLAPPGLHGNRLFDAPLRRFASLHGAISTSRYYTTPMRSASPLAPSGLHGNRLFDAPLRRFASLHGAISTVSRYYTTPMRSASPLAPPGLHGNRLLMRHCAVSLPWDGLKISFYAILKRSFSRL